MRCPFCGNDKFYAYQIIKAYVIVDENGKYYCNLPSGLEDTVCAAKEPVGPYQCTHCGKVYKKINKPITTICCGEKKEWNSPEDAMAYFVDAIKSSVSGERKNYINVYMQLKAGKDYCNDKENNNFI